MKWKINEVAKLTGITVRTLHYYDEIGLLPPSEVTDAGYRMYDSQSLETLQQILFFRELDFSIQDIRDIMNNPGYDKEEALRKHRELLCKKRSRIDDLIQLLDVRMSGDADEGNVSTKRVEDQFDINQMEGEKASGFREFDMTEIEKMKQEYKEEVKQRWGNTDAYKESEEKTATYDKKKWQFLNEEGTALLKEFGECKNLSPESDQAQELVKRWQAYITSNFYTCTNEILKGLGLMYVADQRFTENIDKNGVGTAEFMSKAIGYYCR